MILDARAIQWLYDNLPPEYKMKTLTKESLDRMKNIMRGDPPLTPDDCNALIEHAEDTIDLQSRFDDLKTQYDLLNATAEGLKLEVKTYREFSAFSPNRSDLNNDGPSRAEIAMRLLAARMTGDVGYGSEDVQTALKMADALLEALKK